MTDIADPRVNFLSEQMTLGLNKLHEDHLRLIREVASIGTSLKITVAVGVAIIMAGGTITFYLNENLALLKVGQDRIIGVLEALKPVKVSEPLGPADPKHEQDTPTPSEVERMLLSLGVNPSAGDAVPSAEKNGGPRAFLVNKSSLLEVLTSVEGSELRRQLPENFAIIFASDDPALNREIKRFSIGSAPSKP